MNEIVNSPSVQPLNTETMFQEHVPEGFHTFMQSKMITSARYNLSKIHKDVFICLRMGVQEFIIKTPEKLGVNYVINVPLFLKDFPSFKGRLSDFKEFVEELKFDKSNQIFVSWQYTSSLPQSLLNVLGGDALGVEYHEGDMMEHPFSIVSSVAKMPNRKGLIVTLDPVFIPFLLYCGPGVGGTFLDSNVSLGFNSSRTSRIWEWLMEWSMNKKVVRLPISYFRYMLMLENSLSQVVHLRRKVLDIAKREINESASAVKFDYELIYDPAFPSTSMSVKKKAYNVIVFKIKREDRESALATRNNTLSVLFDSIADEGVKRYCSDYAQKVCDDGNDFRLISKFIYYDKRLRNGQISKDKYVNTMLKLVREIGGVDLRSAEHRRNSTLKKIRSRKEDAKGPALISDTLFG